MTTEFVLRFSSGPYNDGQAKFATLKEAREFALLSGFEQWAVAEVEDGVIKNITHGNHR